MLSSLTHPSRLRTPILVATTLLLAAAGANASEIQPLTKSKLVEVINDVKILQGDSLEAVVAEEAMVFRAPDFLETGRRSRARMEAEDGTITRVGSNTLFSFDEVSRTINLKQGSLLFHSPEGKGGGRVVTASATASVLGTTIMTAATPDGGFKVLVLEGTAQVDFPDGSTRILTAGQMTFVLPGAGINTSTPKQAGADNGETEQPATEGKAGPVLNFELSKLTEDSTLVNGFDDNLPSQTKIERATKEQVNRIAEGEFETTDALIITADEENVVLKINDTASDEKNVVEKLRERRNELDPSDEQLRLRAALDSEIFPNEEGFNEDNFFDYPGVVPFDEVFDLNRADNDERDDSNIGEDRFDPLPENTIAGFVAREITFTGGALDITPIEIPDIAPDDAPGASLVFIGATDFINFSGSTGFTGFTGETYMLASTVGDLTFEEGGKLTIGEDLESYVSVSPLPYKVHLQLDSLGSILLSNFTIHNSYGTVLISTDGSLSIINGSEIFAGSDTFYESTPLNDVSPSPYGNIELFGNESVLLNNTYLSAQGFIRLSSDRSIHLGSQSGLKSAEGFTSIYGREVEIYSEGDIEVANTYIRSFSGLTSISANTTTSESPTKERLVTIDSLDKGILIPNDEDDPYEDYPYEEVDDGLVLLSPTVNLYSESGNIDIGSNTTLDGSVVSVEAQDGDVTFSGGNINVFFENDFRAKANNGDLNIADGVNIDSYYGSAELTTENGHIKVAPSSSSSLTINAQSFQIDANNGNIDLSGPISITAIDDMAIRTSGADQDISISEGNFYADSLEVAASDGDLSIQGSDDSVRKFKVNDTLRFIGGETVTIAASEIEAGYIEIRGQNVDFKGATTITPADMTTGQLQLVAQNLAELSNLDLAGLTTINIASQTLVLTDVNFSSGSTVSLGSALGMLAPNPNTDQDAVSGYVNFIRDVTVDNSLPAQNYVSESQGGTGSAGSFINIYATGSND